MGNNQCAGDEGWVELGELSPVGDGWTAVVTPSGQSRAYVSPVSEVGQPGCGPGVEIGTAIEVGDSFLVTAYRFSSASGPATDQRVDVRWFQWSSAAPIDLDYRARSVRSGVFVLSRQNASTAEQLAEIAVEHATRSALDAAMVAEAIVWYA